MEKPIILVLLFVVLYIIPSPAIAKEVNASQGEAWYKVIAGVIAIPAAVLTLLVTLNMIKKTSLESKKLELEIKEKEKQVSGIVSTETSVNPVHPLGESHRGLLLVVRFIILELALRLWNVIPSAVSYITSNIPTVAMLLFNEKFYKNYKPNGAGIAIIIVPQFISLLFSIVYWAIVFGFGWPLFRDTCQYLNIPIKSLFEIPTLGRRKKKKTKKANSVDTKSHDAI
jgi:hypothetical protein